MKKCIIQLNEKKITAEMKRKCTRMSQCVVRLNGTEEVEEFVKAASKCDFDIDIFYNRIIIDAKSILGILSMDLTRDLTVHCYGDSPAFNKTLQKFAVA